VFDGHHDVAKEHHISEPRINDRIRVPEVRLVGPNGEQVGIVRIEQALQLAQESDLDLVEVAPLARPPVAKLMDFGKFKYESDMKAREARRNQAHTVLKEIRLRLKIDPHDYGTKKGHVERFLKQGDKVKVMIMFRGREQSRPELGYRLLQRMAADVTPAPSPSRDSRTGLPATAAAFVARCGANTMIMFRPSCFGLASMKPNSDTSSANFWSRRKPSSGRDCSRPRNMIVTLTL